MQQFSLIVSLTEFIPLIVGIINWKKLNDKLRIIFWLIAVACLINGVSIYLNEIDMQNVWLYQIYTVIEFFLIVTFFYRLFESDLFKKILKGFITVFIIIVTIAKINLESLNKIDNYTLTISAILLLIVSSMYLVELLLNNMIIDIRDYRLLLTIGFMIYFGANLFIFALSNEVYGIWIVHNIINLLLITIYTGAFLNYVRSN